VDKISGSLQGASFLLDSCHARTGCVYTFEAKYGNTCGAVLMKKASKLRRR
jgi:hypothetical protein